MTQKQYTDMETGEIVTFSFEESFFSVRITDGLTWVEWSWGDRFSHVAFPRQYYDEVWCNSTEHSEQA